MSNSAGGITREEPLEKEILKPEVNISIQENTGNGNIRVGGTFKNADLITIDVRNKTDGTKIWSEPCVCDFSKGEWYYNKPVVAGKEYRFAVRASIRDKWTIKDNVVVPEDEQTEIDDRVDPETLNISQQGIDFIKSWEGFSSEPYNDTNGYCTIGYGHLIDYKRCEDINLPNEFKNGITVERANELFNERLLQYEYGVKRDITVPLYQHEYDALVSLLFNCGANFLNTGGANRGETKIKKHINNKDYEAGADEFSDVTNGGVPGLVRRRKAEINMFKNNIYENN